MLVHAAPPLEHRSVDRTGVEVLGAAPGHVHSQTPPFSYPSREYLLTNVQVTTLFLDLVPRGTTPTSRQCMLLGGVVRRRRTQSPAVMIPVPRGTSGALATDCQTTRCERRRFHRPMGRLVREFHGKHARRAQYSSRARSGASAPHFSARRHSHHVTTRASLTSREGACLKDGTISSAQNQTQPHGRHDCCT